MAWRAKQMSLDEWGAFQNDYEASFMASGGDPRLALFIQKTQGEAGGKMLIPSFKSELVEALSPGDWEDHPHPEGQWIGLLVGAADAHERYDIKLGSHE